MYAYGSGPSPIALKRMAFPPGSSCGQIWKDSPAIGVVTAVGVPPADETRQIPFVTSGVKKMVSCASQLAERLLLPAISEKSAMDTGAPPLRGTFLIF